MGYGATGGPAVGREANCSGVPVVGDLVPAHNPWLLKRAVDRLALRHADGAVPAIALAF
jgi:hypothetical protein